MGQQRPRIPIFRFKPAGCWKFLCIFAILIAVPSVFAASPQADAAYQHAVDALYNLDFSIAESGFNNLIRQDGSNPEYWNGLASTIWLKILYDQQKLNVDSYSGSSLGTADSRDSINPEDEKRLRDTIATAIAKADAILAKNPNDVRALYAKGSSNATLAAFEGIGRRSYTAAIGKAKAARDLHQRVLKLDPGYNDAWLSVGTYEYGVGAIPWFFRLMLGLVGAGGNKEEGIRKLEIAAEKGNQASTDAKVILIVFYNRERRYDQSLRLIDELLAKYPRNFQLEMEKASVYGRMNNWEQASHTYEHILAKIHSRQDGFERLREERVYFELGKSHINNYHSDAAIEPFNRVVQSKKSTMSERANSYLWLGKIYDSAGQRQKALDQYRAVLNLDCDPESKNEARKYQRVPFK